MLMQINENTGGIQFEKWSGRHLPDSLITAIWAIAEDSFPPEEREPCQVFLQSIENGKSTLYVALRQKEVFGFTKLTRLGTSAIYLMEYLAVQRRMRNRGAGSAILVYVCADLSQVQQAAILLEVEPPGAVKGEESRLRERRIQFYRRHGASLILDQDAYRMPNLVADGSLWMHLMWLPVEKESLPPDNLSLSGLFQLIYRETYPGEKNGQVLAHMLRQIHPPDTKIILEKDSHGLD